MHSSNAWLEIPVKNYHRANSFYVALFGEEVTEISGENDKYAMLLPGECEKGLTRDFEASESEITTQVPLVFLRGSSDIDTILSKVESAGGRIISPKKSLNGLGFIALIVDSEGNKLAFHSNT